MLQTLTWPAFGSPLQNLSPLAIVRRCGKYTREFPTHIIFIAYIYIMATVNLFNNMHGNALLHLHLLQTVRRLPL